MLSRPATSVIFPGAQHLASALSVGTFSSVIDHLDCVLAIGESLWVFLNPLTVESPRSSESSNLGNLYDLPNPVIWENLNDLLNPLTEDSLSFAESIFDLLRFCLCAQ